MNIVFITLVKIENIEDRNIYSDLIRFFISKGHFITVFSPLERRENKESYIIESPNYRIVRFKSFNLQKIGIVEKLIGTVLVDYLLSRAIKKFLKKETTIDLVLYSTPPITISNSVGFIKKHYKAKTYLLLKDIFPQNAVDLGMVSSKNPLLKYFLHKEKKLYAISDIIGCMSMANVNWLLKHHSYLDARKIEIASNSIELSSQKWDIIEKNKAKKQLNIDLEQRVFIFGGNLGIPQGIDFLLNILELYNNDARVVFIIVGSGTEYKKIEERLIKIKSQNIILKPYAPKEEFDNIILAADYGIISLNHKFTIPNYPSRILSLMEARIPVLSITDPNTDINELIEDNNFGVSTINNDIEDVKIKIEFLLNLSMNKRLKMGENAYKCLEENFQVKDTYNTIMNHCKDISNL